MANVQVQIGLDHPVRGDARLRIQVSRIYYGRSGNPVSGMRPGRLIGIISPSGQSIGTITLPENVNVDSTPRELVTVNALEIIGDDVYYMAFLAFGFRRLVKYNLTTSSIVNSIPSSLPHRGLGSHNGNLYSYNNNTISIYDTDLSLTSTISLTSSPIIVGRSISGISIINNQIWLLANNNGTIFIFDLNGAYDRTISTLVVSSPDIDHKGMTSIGDDIFIGGRIDGSANSYVKVIDTNGNRQSSKEFTINNAWIESLASEVIPSEADINVQIGRDHPIRGAVTLEIIHRVDRRVMVGRDHPVRGFAEIYTGFPSEFTREFTTEFRVDTVVDIQVQVGLDHPIRGAVTLDVQKDIQVQVGLDHPIRGAIDLDVSPIALLQVRVDLDHPIRGSAALTITGPTETDRDIQVGLDHPIRGAVTLTVAPPTIADVRVRVGLDHPVQGRASLVVRQLVIPVDVRVEVGLTHPIRGAGNIRVSLLVGGISLFDDRVAGGWPAAVYNPTPGVPLQFTRTQFSTNGTDYLVDSRDPNTRMSYQFPRIYVSQEAYVSRIRLTNNRLEVYLSPTADGAGDESGPTFNDVALDRLGLAIQTANNFRVSYSFSDLRRSDSTEPYSWTIDPAAAAELRNDLVNNVAAKVVIVDEPFANIDFSTLSCQATRLYESNGNGYWKAIIGRNDVGEEYVLQDSVDLTRRLGARGEASFTMKYRPTTFSNWPGNVPLDNEEAIILWVENQTNHVVRMFGGLVINPDSTILPGGRWLQTEVQLTSYASRLDELLIEDFYRTTTGNTITDEAINLISRYAPTENFDSFGATASEVADPAVFDHVPISDAFNEFIKQNNGAWDVSEFRDLMLAAPNQLVIYPTTLEYDDHIKDLKRRSDRQNLRSTQIVIGGSPQSGERRQDFITDGVTREFKLQYRPERVKDVSINGIGQSFDTDQGANPQWVINLERGTLVQRASDATRPRGDNLTTIYDFNFPIVAKAENSRAVSRYRRIYSVIQNAAADTLEVAERQANRELRHEHPTVTLDAQCVPGRTTGLREGMMAPLVVPQYGINGERWLVDSIGITSIGRKLIYNSVEFQRTHHESLFNEQYRKARRLTEPTQPLEGIRRQTAGGHTITPEVLATKGTQLPAQLGGASRGVIRDTDWVNIPEFVIARLNGDELPTAIIVWLCNARVSAEGIRGFIRLFNDTGGNPVGPVVEITNVSALPIIVPNITLNANLNDYVLQGRKIGGTSRQGLYVWGGQLEAAESPIH